jgi:hypothetical protein
VLSAFAFMPAGWESTLSLETQKASERLALDASVSDGVHVAPAQDEGELPRATT